MRRTTLPLALILILVPGLAPGQQSDACDQLADLIASVQRLTEVLQSLQESRDEEMELRRVEVTISYLELRMLRSQEKEVELRQLKERRRDLEEQVESFESTRKHYESDEESVSDEERQEVLKQINQMAEETGKRLADLELEIITIENELAARRRELDPLEELVTSYLQ
jgi:Skp family chaperone for outer membrane proteins